MSNEPVIPSGSRAVLIGVPKYQDDRYRSYTAVRNSLQGMRALLAETGLCGWRKDQVTTLTNPRNSSQLLRDLRKLARDTTGVLLFYFVGHGVLSEQGELCLAIADTDYDDPDATGLEYEKIRRMLHDITPARTRIAILDCCYSGRGIGLGSSGETQLADLSQADGAYTLTAADDFAATGTSRTAFTGELLGLLTRGIPGGPAGLTLGTIFPVLRHNLTARGLPRPNQRSDDSVAAFVFARNAAPALTETPPPQPVVLQVPPAGVGRTAPARPVPTRRTPGVAPGGGSPAHTLPTRPRPARRAVPAQGSGRQPRHLAAWYAGGLFAAAGCFIAANLLPLGGFSAYAPSGIKVAHVTFTFNLIHPFVWGTATGPDAAKVYVSWWLAPLIGVGTAVSLAFALTVLFQLLRRPTDPVDLKARTERAYGLSVLWGGFFAVLLVLFIWLSRINIADNPGNPADNLYDRATVQAGTWLLFAASAIAATTLRQTRKRLGPPRATKPGQRKLPNLITAPR